MHANYYHTILKYCYFVLIMLSTTMTSSTIIASGEKSDLTPLTLNRSLFTLHMINVDTHYTMSFL